MSVLVEASGPRAGGNAPTRQRRIVAVVLPDLLIELAQRKKSRDVSHLAKNIPLGVVLRSASEVAPREPEQLSFTELGKPSLSHALPAVQPLSAVNAAAERYGVKAGQTIAQASALVSELVVVTISVAEVEQTLGSLAEIASAYGATVSIAVPDTIWIDITGAAHLFGGEEALARDLWERVRQLGHRTRVAVSVGPELARAFARWSLPARAGQASVWIIDSERTEREALELPLQALPLSPENADYLQRLGLLTLGELKSQPPSALAPRLGKEAARVLELCSGKDGTPLVPYCAPRTLVEESSWEEPVVGVEPLGFVLRGLAARISARLSARAVAAEELVVTLTYDPIMARWARAQAWEELRFKLSRPLYREAELRRIVASRLERLELAAPTLGMKLEVTRLASAHQRQLSLSELFAEDTASGEEDLPIVLAELVADIGEDRVGVLSVIDAHRPEAQSVLGCALMPPETRNTARKHRATRRKPPQLTPKSSLRKAEPAIWSRMPNPPTRLLLEPLELHTVLSPGSTLLLGHTLFTIEHLRFEKRLEGVEWWSDPVARDYLRLWLNSENGGLEALVYVDRRSGRRFLQAVGD